jgi:hypothetical protein
VNYNCPGACNLKRNNVYKKILSQIGHTKISSGIMAKTAVVKARTEPELKEEVENILHELGLSPTEAVTLFYRLVNLRKGYRLQWLFPI